MANSEGITYEMTQFFALFGEFKNNWRRRTVEVYEHPTDDDKVVTVGHPFGGGDPIVCVEPRRCYARQIETGRWPVVN